MTAGSCPPGPLLFSDLYLRVASLQGRLSHSSCLLGLIPWMRFCLFWDDLILISLPLWSVNSLRGGMESLLFIYLTALGLSCGARACPAARGILVPQPGIRPKFPCIGLFTPGPSGGVPGTASLLFLTVSVEPARCL